MKKRKRNGMKIKVPVKELEKNDACLRVEETLKNDLQNAYTVAGIMVTTFGISQKDIHNKPFSQWKPGQSALYARIDRCLKKLFESGKVNCRKDGKAFVHWWIQKPEKKLLELRE